ncbi:MAG: methyl-accepting chemotaxis protein [Candidatus Muiribacteriota bacterium]
MKRRNYLVNKTFQFKLIFVLALIVIFSTNLTASLIYAFLGGHIDLTRIIGIPENNFLLPSIIIAQAISIIFIIILGMFLSHTMAGPIYRFEKAMRALSSKDFTGDFKLRQNDEFKNLAQLINNMVKKLNTELLDIEKNINELKKIAENIDNSEEIELKKTTEEMKKTIYELTRGINEFKLKHD